MFAREEFLPPLVRFSNIIYRTLRGWTVNHDVETAREQLGRSLLELKARLAWELPLLTAFEEGPETASRVAKALEILESAVGQTDAENFSFVFTPVQDDFLGGMRDAGALREQLPVFTDVRIVNELLLLATARAEGRVEIEPIGQRLPLLIDWINRKEVDWRTYARLFPDQEPAKDRVLAALEAMRTGVGALHLYLVGEEPQGLKDGLDIVLKALERLSEAEETRFHTESERVEFSPDLRLERAWRGADISNWEETSLPAELLEFYQETVKRTFALAQQTLMPMSLLEEAAEVAEALQGRLVTAFETLMAQRNIEEGKPARPPRAQALAELDAVRREVDACFEKIAAYVEQNRPLEQVPLYAHVVGTLVGILQETAPDSHLHALVESTDMAQAGFVETLERTANSAEGSEPDQREALEKSWAALEQQSGINELLWRYLDDGDRLGLYEAYEALAEPLSALASYAVAEPTEPDEARLTTCPFCQQEVALESGKCPECRRLVDIEAAQSTVTITTGQGTSSALVAQLDARTSSLKPGEPRDALAGEWRGLAARLEALGKTASRQGLDGETRTRVATLVGLCHEVADGLNQKSFEYGKIRGDFLSLFQALEESAKSADRM